MHEIQNVVCFPNLLAQSSSNEIYFTKQLFESLKKKTQMLPKRTALLVNKIFFLQSVFDII